MARIQETQTLQDKPYLHWLCQTLGTGSRGFLRALLSLYTPQEIYALAAADQLVDKVAARFQKKAAYLTENGRNCDVQGEYEKLAAWGIDLTAQGEETYPARLAQIPDAPPVLYYAGALPQEKAPAVALIGARDCTEYGRSMAALFGSALAKAGVQVISGMARGIDGIGQEKALAAGGYSLGVLGCGVDICYPRENRELYEALLAGGGLCSEYPPQTPPKAILFPPRNRIISGLADAVLVIEAREKSGTLITVDMALEQGREVYALPGRATDPLSGGCNRLIRQGAGLVTSPEELLEELFQGAGMPRTQTAQTALVFLDGLSGDLLSVLDFSPLPAQEIQRRFLEKYGKNLELPQLFQALLELCAQGHAGQIGGCYFMRILKT